MDINTNYILEMLRKTDPNLDAPVIKIEFKGVVDHLVVKSIYLVPASDQHPFALHIEVQEADGAATLVTLTEATEVFGPGTKQGMKCLPLEQRDDTVDAVNWAATHMPNRLSKLRDQYERGILTDNEFITMVRLLPSMEKDSDAN